MSKILHGSTAAFLIGMTAIGRATMASCIAMLANTQMCVVIKTSDVLRWALQLHGRLGDQLRLFQERMEIGEIIPNELVMAAMTLYLEKLHTQRPGIKRYIIVGFPLNETQLQLACLFESYELIHLSSAPMQSTIFKLDEPQEKNERFNNQWTLYAESTRPFLTRLNGKVLLLHREEPLSTRIEESILHIGFPPHVKKKMLARLKSPRHPVHKMIRHIETPVGA